MGTLARVEARHHPVLNGRRHHAVAGNALGLLVLVAAVGRAGGSVLELIGGLSFAASLVLGIRHGQQGRVRTATGALIGTFLWPTIAGGLAFWALIHALSHAHIPF